MRNSPSSSPGSWACRPRPRPPRCTNGSSASTERYAAAPAPPCFPHSHADPPIGACQPGRGLGCGCHVPPQPGLASSGLLPGGGEPMMLDPISPPAARRPEETVELVSAALSDGDLEAVLAQYERGAVL